jgi:tRNA pseudouridine13 synthase
MLPLSRGVKAAGTIKELPEDFVVEEIARNGAVLEVDRGCGPEQLGMASNPGGGSAVFVMQKYGWNTLQALKAVAEGVGRGAGAVGFAGTKDRVSKSVQLCSVFGADPDRLKALRIKDIRVNGAWRGEKVGMGELAGNRFTITVRELSGFDALAGAAASTVTFPNYFGAQRFGSRGNNFEVGLDILKGSFEDAAMRCLTEIGNETNAEAMEARRRLAEQRDFKEALGYFPKHLRYERSMIDYLSRFDGAYANALRRLPRSLLLMFVHSVEDRIFNMELENMIHEGHTEPRRGDIVCRPDPVRFYDLSARERCTGDDCEGYIVGNILGHTTQSPTAFEKEEMERLGLSLGSFRVRGMSELNCKGASRVMFAPVRGMECARSGENGARLRFSLPAGSYATVLLGELMETRRGG